MFLSYKPSLNKTTQTIRLQSPYPDKKPEPVLIEKNVQLSFLKKKIYLLSSDKSRKISDVRNSNLITSRLEFSQTRYIATLLNLSSSRNIWWQPEPLSAMRVVQPQFSDELWLLALYTACLLRTYCFVYRQNWRYYSR